MVARVVCERTVRSAEGSGCCLRTFGDEGRVITCVCDGIGKPLCKQVSALDAGFTIQRRKLRRVYHSDERDSKITATSNNM